MAALHPDRWELGAEPGPDGIHLDARLRIHVPAGVRHQLGLCGEVVIILAAGRNRIVVWSAFRLDDVVEL